MAKRMLIDATHPEQTRVAVVDGHRLLDYDFETQSRKQLKGNIYLAKVIRIEPSLQAAFVEYGGNRHGFLAFSEIHHDYYRIPVADRQALEESLAQESAYMGHGGFDADEQPPYEEGAAIPFDDEEIQEDQITQDVLPPAIGLTPSPSDSGLMMDPFADAGADEEGTGEEGDGQNLFAPIDQNADLTGEGLEPIGAELNGEGGEEAPSVDMVGGDELEGAREQRRRRFIRRYKIQEVIKRGQIMLIQVVKEERGNKGAALTTYLSLAGRYCVLMPNTDKGGGISRKITSMQDRRRLKDLLDQLETPDGMAVILRTAGMERSKIEVKRDLEYLLRLWDSIRELTLKSIAPSLIYEEANLIKRAIRDLYTPDIDTILVEGDDGYHRARDFMRMLMPSHARRVHHYRDQVIPLLFRYQVENQINGLHSPVVQLRSGGYIVINQTEALVAIDVNSGRATRERNIEETAYRTNLEAAEEIARQLRLRDLAGLIVIDFIDMEDGRNNSGVERRLKDSMRNDRARLQIGRISHFGLLELSRQRLRPSLLDLNFEKCPHCQGTGHVRHVDSAALLALHAVEEEGMRQNAAEIIISMPDPVALYILNNKREILDGICKRYNMNVRVRTRDDVIPPDFPIERIRTKKADEKIVISMGVDDPSLYAPQGEPVDGEDQQGEGGDSGTETFGGGNIETVDDDNFGGDVTFESGGADSNGSRFRDDRRDRGDRGDRGGRGGRRRGRRGGRRRNGPNNRFPEGSEGANDQPGIQAEGMAAPDDVNGNVALPEGVPANDMQGQFQQQQQSEFNERRNFDRRDRDQNRDQNRDRGRRGGRGGRQRYDRNDRNDRGDRGDRQRQNYNPNFNQAEGGQGAGGFGRAQNVPINVLDIDTTPRENGGQAARAFAPQTDTVSAPRFDAGRDIPIDTTPKDTPPVLSNEGMDISPEKKKTGWWQRLTGA